MGYEVKVKCIDGGIWHSIFKAGRVYTVDEKGLNGPGIWQFEDFLSEGKGSPTDRWIQWAEKCGGMKFKPVGRVIRRF